MNNPQIKIVLDTAHFKGIDYPSAFISLRNINDQEKHLDKDLAKARAEVKKQKRPPGCINELVANFVNKSDKIYRFISSTIDLSAGITDDLSAGITDYCRKWVEAE